MGRLDDVISIFSDRRRKPRVVQFPINDICNSRCQMCDIWKRKLTAQVDPATVEKIFSDPLFSKVQSVGLNGGEPTLRADLPELAVALCRVLPRLAKISLITNAIRGSALEPIIARLGDAMLPHGVALDVMVSIDGIGDVHDQVRGRPGNFTAAAELLSVLGERHPRIDRRIGCTIIKDNVYDAERVLHWAEDHGVYARFRLGIPHRRLYSDDDRECFDLDAARRYHLLRFLRYLSDVYEPARGGLAGYRRAQFYRSLIGQVAYGKPRASRCWWQTAGVTVSSRGELLYCAVASASLGDAATESPSSLWSRGDQELDRIRRQVCAGCPHDYDGPLTIRQVVAYLGAAVLDRAPVVARVVKETISRVESRAWRSCRIAACPAGEGQLPVLIVGWYGTETTGDKAILAGIRAVLDDRPLVVASLEPFLTRETVLQMGDELGGVSVVSWPEAQALVAAGGCTAVVMGGGPIMTVREVAWLAGIFAAAKSIGLPTMIAGCGMGPFTRREYLHGVRGLLAATDHAWFRDEESLTVARRFCPQSRWLTAGVSGCPASIWLERSVGRLAQQGQGLAGHVAFGVRDYPIDYAANRPQGRRLRESMAESWTSVVGRCLEAGRTVSMIPMHAYAVGGDDRFFTARIVRDLGRRSAPLERIQTWSGGPSLTPLQTLGRIADTELAIGMRYHFTMFAAALGRRLISIDYAVGGGKVTALARRLGFSAACLSMQDAQDRLRADPEGLDALGVATSRGAFSAYADECSATLRAACAGIPA